MFVQPKKQGCITACMVALTLPGAICSTMKAGWTVNKNRKLISYPSHVADNAVSIHADSYFEQMQSTF